MYSKVGDKSSLYFIIVVILIIVIPLALNWDKIRSGNAGRFYEKLSTPHSGEDEVLPKEVQSVLKYLRANKIKTIGMTPAIAKNRFIAQPLTESAYPITVSNSSNIFVSYSSELLPNCAPLNISIGKGIRIVSCR